MTDRNIEGRCNDCNDILARGVTTCPRCEHVRKYGPPDTQLEKLAKQALAVLVMDLGYEKEPVYGHSPMRHQNLWAWAAKALTPEQVEHEVTSDIVQRDEEEYPTVPQLMEALKDIASGKLNHLQHGEINRARKVLGLDPQDKYPCHACEKKVRERYLNDKKQWVCKECFENE